MVNVYRSIGNFESGSALLTWLHRIVVNSALMKLRTRKRHPEEDIEQYLPRFLEDGHQRIPSTPWTKSAPESAQTVLEREELRAAVRAAIDKLPEAYRIVLQLRDIEETQHRRNRGNPRHHEQRRQDPVTPRPTGTEDPAGPFHETRQMTPTCQQLIDFLDDYVTGDLPPDRAEGFETHLPDAPPASPTSPATASTIHITQQISHIEIEDIPADLLTAILATVTTRK